jgi:tRNA (guanine37-N1)-methyltransferase
LRSGDHGKVARWRLAKAIERTAHNRPDLLDARGGLSADEQRALDEFGIDLPER